MDWELIQHFIDRFGVSLFVACWFMFRHEKQVARLTSKVNKLIITNVLIARTLDLDAEQERLISAATDEDSGPQKGT
jgi:hypothetical protein